MTDPRANGCGGCNPAHPIPADALTVREWDALAARRYQPRLRHRIAERLAVALVCPDCLLPRIAPAHWLHR